METVELGETWALAPTLARSDVYRIAGQARFAKRILVMNAATLHRVAVTLHVRPENVGAAIGLRVDAERGAAWPDGIVTAIPR